MAKPPGFLSFKAIMAAQRDLADIEFREYLPGAYGSVPFVFGETNPKPQAETNPYVLELDEEPPEEKKCAPQPKALIEDLKAINGMTAQELKNLRRRVARDFHPDRFDAEYRDEATRLMSDANSRIDEALKQITD